MHSFPAHITTILEKRAQLCLPFPLVLGITKYARFSWLTLQLPALSIVLVSHVFCGRGLQRDTGLKVLLKSAAGIHAADKSGKKRGGNLCPCVHVYL